MEQISFPELKGCKACPLWESAKNPGIPTRPYSVTGKPKAVLVVGEAPGLHEDNQYKSWVGQAGTVLTRFLDVSHLSDHADVYLSNSCRCHPPKNADPTATQVNTCRVHLQSDLNSLLSSYKEVVILCCGKFGAQAVTRQTTLSGCFSMQGRSLSYFNGLKKDCLSGDARVFFTYHPGALFSNRQPHQVVSVADHFTLLLRYLKEEFIPNSIEVVPDWEARVPRELPDIVCVDIETYGILRGVNQTVFHPAKSHHIDKVPFGKQIVTVAFGFKDSQSPVGYRTCVYSFRDHIHLIRSWFRRVISTGTTLIGQNIKYDLLYLRMNDPILNEILTPSSIMLDDTLLASFLFYEQRPEKGLKELATLFGLTDYSKLAVTGSSGTATSKRDPNLLYYNCLDVATTIALYDFTWEEIKKKYGENSPKMSEVCKQMRNQVIWDTIILEQNGCAMDKWKLIEVDKEHRAKCKQAIGEAKEAGVIIEGTGSEASSRQFIETALRDMSLIHDKRVQLTEKKREISVCKDNFNLLIESSTPDSPHWKPVQAIKKYSECSKIVDSYTNRLLNYPSRGIVHDNMTYPIWYPTSGLGSKGSQKTGGTIQGRFACKDPGAQTFPSVIKEALTSRMLGGRVKSYDASQMELRIAAFLSGDPPMIGDYLQGIDRHLQTAKLIWPHVTKENKDERYAGKTLNFLVLYRGGAKKFQETLLKDVGLTLSLERCQEVISLFNQRHFVFRQWQETNQELVRQQGYLVLPTGWSRSWGTGSTADNFVSEIADFPIQTISAQVMQAGQFEVEKELHRRRMRTKVILQIHDALYFDGPREEEDELDEICFRILPHPSLMSFLEDFYGRTVPIIYEKETY